MTKSTQELLDQHIENADREFSRLNDKMDIMMNNHLAHIAVDLAKVKVDLRWLKKWHWVVSVPAAVGALTGISNFFS